MTPDGGPSLLARVKRIAQPFAHAVQSRHDRPAESARHADLLTAGMSAEELRALAVVLAEAVDLDVLRLVCEADDAGTVPKPSAARSERSHAA